MALPVGRNLTIYQGDSFSLSFRLRDRDEDGGIGDYVDLTDCTAKAQIRTTEANSTVMAEFDAQIPTQTGDDLGKVDLILTPAQTANLADGKWDVQITFPDGWVQTYLKGTVTVTKEVTRA